MFYDVPDSESPATLPHVDPRRWPEIQSSARPSHPSIHLLDRFLPSPLRTLLQRLEVNRAVGYLLLSRGWQFVSGIVTQALIISCLDDSTNGNYVLFNNLLGIQLFVELGVPVIVMFVTSHEWSQLRFDERGHIEGDVASLDRLAGLNRFITRWFQGCAAAFLVGMSIYGYYAIGERGQRLDLLLPWLALITANSAAIVLMPKIAMLEGCNQVGTINAVRFPQAITGTIVVWCCLLMNCGLWTLVASTIVRWAWEYVLVRVRYREAFRSLVEHHIAQPISWFQELWPLSWRTAIQTIGQYFSSSYFVLLVRSFQGESETGRFGNSWQILTAMQTAALSWINTRTPEFGTMAARGEHRQLRQRMVKTGLISLGVFLSGTAAFTAVLWALQKAEVRQVERFLDLKVTGLLIAGLAFILISNVLQISVRIYKKDPFLFPNSITSFLIAILSWYSCQRWGSLGMAVTYCAVTGGWQLPMSAFLAWQHQRSLGNVEQTEPIA